MIHYFYLNNFLNMYNDKLKWKILSEVSYWELNRNQIAKKYNISYATIARWIEETDIKNEKVKEDIDDNKLIKHFNIVFLILFWVLILLLINMLL